MVADYSPFAYAMDWRRILDFALLDFFKVFNSDFTCDKNTETYVYSGNATKYGLKKFFSESIAAWLEKMAAKIGREKKRIKHVYVIETCRINDNIANKISGKKTDEARLNTSYSLMEKDIVIDLVKFEDIFTKIFNDYFSGKLQIPGFKFVKHKNFKSKTIIKLIRQHYGTEHFTRCNWRYFGLPEKPRRILLDLNDSCKINKKQLTKHEDLVNCKLTEIKQFLGFV